MRLPFAAAAIVLLVVAVTALIHPVVAYSAGMIFAVVYGAYWESQRRSQAEHRRLMQTMDPTGER